MTIVVGGARTRLIRQSLYSYVNAGLTTLGWFDPGRQHQPVTFVQKELPSADEIKPNTIGLADGPVTDTEIECGSILAEHRLNYYVDVWAEGVAVGLHIAGDIKDILQGRFSTSLSQSGPMIPVF